MSVSEQFTCWNKFFFRTPLLPADHNERSFIDSDLFRESIYLASRDLYERLLKEGSSTATNRDLKLEHSLFKYLSRMKSRCVPFGLFASVGVGEIGEETKVILRAPTSNRTKTRLDMNFVCSLGQHLSSLPEISAQLKYFPNSSGYAIHNGYRYVEYKYVGSRRKYYLAEVDRSPELESVLTLCATGATRSSLINKLMDAGVDDDSATKFVIDLIDNQLLVSGLDPCVTGGDAFNSLLSTMTALSPDHHTTHSLNLISAALTKIDTQTIGRSIVLYEKIEEEIATFGIEYDKKHLFQSDMICFPEKAVLGKDVIDQAFQCFSLLNKLIHYQENQLLTRFKEEFHKRYEEEEIPLVVALDGDLGVGFGSSVPETTDVNELLAGLPNLASPGQR